MSTKLILNRNMRSADGVFGKLTTESNRLIAFTLEHAYATPPPKGVIDKTKTPPPQFYSKINAGLYTCVLGQHQLASMKSPFITYEITGVAGHTNILFHVGNKNSDSEGCVLLGNSIARTGSRRELVGSKIAFLGFLSELDGADSFVLEVRDAYQ